MEGATLTASRQYLTFRLGEESFAVNVGRVREILDFGDVAKVPQTPTFMRGVINLRGSVVPVMDLRLKIGMTATERTAQSCIIVVEMSLGGELLVLGMLADAVQEVIELTPDQIEPPPRIGTRLDTEVIFGMGKHDHQFLIILDIDKLFGQDAEAVAAEAA